MEGLESIIDKLRLSRSILDEAAKLMASDEIHKLIKVHEDKEYDIERVYSIDGGFRYIRPYTGTLTIMRVYRVEHNVIDQTFSPRPIGYIERGSLKGRIGNDLYIVYLEDLIIEESSLMMLFLEAKLANELLSEGKEPLILDGPIINPPIKLSYKKDKDLSERQKNVIELFESNELLRGKFFNRQVFGIIKRPQRSMLKDYIDRYLDRARRDREESFVSENMFVFSLFAEARRILYEEMGKEAYFLPITIGPLKYIYYNGDVTYNRYLQRTVGHKMVIVESSSEEFPEWIVDRRVRPRSARLRGPAALEMAHIFANVKEEEANNVASILYRILRKELHG